VRLTADVYRPGRRGLTQPPSVAAEQFLANWHEEALAAMQAQAAGVIKGLWKVAGQRVSWPCSTCPTKTRSTRRS
jgi:hypothetical protein